MINEIVVLLREIGKEKIDKYDGDMNDYTFHIDFVNEYIFVSLSREDLKDVNIDNYFEYEDVSVIDLQDLEEYDLSMREIVYELLLATKECLKGE